MFEVDSKEIFPNCSNRIKVKAGKKTNKKAGEKQSVRWKV